ncbi:aspartyl/asparaginyl beta-hydroxylase domain-containing protein [Sphingomonas sp. UYAg733]
MSVKTTSATTGLWPKSGNSDEQRTIRVPDLNVISGAPVQGAKLEADPNRPLIIRFGKHLRGIFDRLIASSSLVSNDPVLDVRDFAWTAILRDNWEVIRDEAIEVALQGQASPSLATISPDHRSIAQVDMWRSFFLWGYGFPIEDNLARCPKTQAIVERIPGLNSAFFSILAPGTHIPDHRGVTKGLITCHLGLIVPQDGDVRMRVDDRIVRWAEGETLVFDDTYQHEVWNDTIGTRVVLLVQFERPLRQPGRWIADTFLKVVRKSAFVQEARDNIATWNDAMKKMDV